MEIPLTLLNSQRGPGTGVSPRSRMKEAGVLGAWESLKGAAWLPGRFWAAQSSLGQGSRWLSADGSVSRSVRACIIAFFLISEDSESISLPVYLEKERM